MKTRMPWHCQGWCDSENMLICRWKFENAGERDVKVPAWVQGANICIVDSQNYSGPLEQTNWRFVAENPALPPSSASKTTRCIVVHLGWSIQGVHRSSFKGAWQQALARPAQFDIIQPGWAVWVWDFQMNVLETFGLTKLWSLNNLCSFTLDEQVWPSTPPPPESWRFLEWLASMPPCQYKPKMHAGLRVFLSFHRSTTSWGVVGGALRELQICAKAECCVRGPVCPSGLRRWAQVPLAQTLWVQTPQRHLKRFKALQKDVLANRKKESVQKTWYTSRFSCHPCAGTMLIISASFHFIGCSPKGIQRSAKMWEETTVWTDFVTKTPPVGFEPTIFGLEVQRLVH